MTSLYQVALRGKVVETITPEEEERLGGGFISTSRRRLDPSVERDEAIIAVPEDKKLTRTLVAMLYSI